MDPISETKEIPCVDQIPWLENISPPMHKKCSHSEFFWSVLSRIPTSKNPNAATFHAVRVPQG